MPSLCRFRERRQGSVSCQWHKEKSIVGSPVNACHCTNLAGYVQTSHALMSKFKNNYIKFSTVTNLVLLIYKCSMEFFQIKCKIEEMLRQKTGIWLHALNVVNLSVVLDFFIFTNIQQTMIWMIFNYFKRAFKCF